MTAWVFDPWAMLRVLVEHEVEFVLIGGLAATLYGSPHVTTDVDISPSSASAESGTPYGRVGGTGGPYSR